MRVCHFCEAENEDWMKICQQCGNPIIDSSNRNEDDEISYEYNSYDESESSKPANLDLKIIIAVLLVVLVALIIYTFYVVTNDGKADDNAIENNVVDVENNEVVENSNVVEE